ncbi:MAG: cation transporter [bacterium]|nr:cation transporter [bacterium]
MDLKKRALFLSYFTVIYNILEGIISVAAGLFAGSISLIGFGFDSFVESLSGGVMIWRFSLGDKLSQEAEEKIERQAERFVAVTFFVLAAYVLYESVKKLVFHEVPEISLLGFAITILSLIIMPALYLVKRETGKRLGSKSLIADSKETLACCYLSAAVLIGLVFNAWLGWWWADPIVGLLIVYFLIKEGIEAWSGGCKCGDE